MFASLLDTVDTLDVPVDSDALESLLVVRDRFEAKVVAAVAAFDDTDQWAAEDGASSMTAWLRHNGRMTAADAHRLAHTARRLRTLPALRDAWAVGAVSGGHVAAVMANLSDRTAPLFAEHEDDLVPVLAGLEVTDAAAAMRHWAVRAKESLDDTRPDEPDPERSAHLSPTLDGTGRLDASLDAEGYQTARKALDLAQGACDADDPRTAAQRRHDALVEVFTFFLDHQHAHLGGRHRPHVNIVVTLAALLAAKEAGQAAGHGADADGTPVSAEDARRLACDANVHRVITRGESSVLDYGRATRVVSAALFSVLAVRDHGCRFPGCDRPATWTDAHHIHHWVDGGVTAPHNLVLLCRHHHQVVHRKGWAIEMDHTGDVTVTDPTGRRRTTHPPGCATDLAA